MDKKTAIYSVFVMVIVFFAICILNIFTGRSEVAFSYPSKEQSAQLSEESENSSIEQVQENDNLSAPNGENANVEYIDKSEAEIETEKDFTEVEFERDLYAGMVGDDVKKAQYLLEKAGYYDGEINGEFDDKTKRAVILYQRDNVITQTGNIGKMTRASLIEINEEK